MATKHQEMQIHITVRYYHKPTKMIWGLGEKGKGIKNWEKQFKKLYKCLKLILNK